MDNKFCMEILCGVVWVESVLMSVHSALFLYLYCSGLCRKLLDPSHSYLGKCNSMHSTAENYV